MTNEPTTEPTGSVTWNPPTETVISVTVPVGGTGYAQAERRVKVGDIVLTMINGQVRPAIVVHVWSKETINAVGFLDGSNYYSLWNTGDPLTIWLTSLTYQDQPGVGYWSWQD